MKMKIKTLVNLGFPVRKDTACLVHLRLSAYTLGPGAPPLPPVTVGFNINSPRLEY